MEIWKYKKTDEVFIQIFNVAFNRWDWVPAVVSRLKYKKDQKKVQNHTEIHYTVIVEVIHQSLVDLKQVVKKEISNKKLIKLKKDE